MTPAPGEAEVERMARLIDPSAWDGWHELAKAESISRARDVIDAGYARRDAVLEEAAKVADAEVVQCIADNAKSKMHFGVGAAVASRIAAAIRAGKGGAGV